MAAGKSKHWVLLAAGSTDWENYRHQAIVCHAYQVMHQNGIPDEQIVVMMYDDIANHKDNPDKGKIINVPKGPNVYPGVPKDYTGADVTADNFLAVLRGDSSAVKKTGAKKVIQSGKNDTVFIYLSDHGGHGVFHFPNSTLYAHDLINTVTAMSKAGKFSQMVIYIEACHSGSMLDQLKDSNVYAVSSCRPDESGYAHFYDQRLNAWISGVFGANWLQHTEIVKLSTTSFGDQFSFIKKNVIAIVQRFGESQTPCNYGDMNISKVMLSEVICKSPAPVTRARSVPPTDFTVSEVIDTIDIPLQIKKNMITNEKDPEKKKILERQYDDLVRKRKTMDEALQKIAEQLKAPQTLREKREVTRTYELKVVAEHFKNNLFNWEKEPHVVTHLHLQVLVNLCESGLKVESINEAITRVSKEISF
ncbi:legumain-like isoform X1 [Tachysurus vachellii]|uniref:legumain-like isoform X1 n=1 Tax=Tachysurus vachellii TaxID=175792 RepID=UPI00296AEB56|nr:legumain-like isoform X1 [Tachysurus vachellii]